MPVSAEQWRASVGSNSAARWHGRDKAQEKTEFEDQLMTYIMFLFDFYREINFQGNNSIPFAVYHDFFFHPFPHYSK